MNIILEPSPLSWGEDIAEIFAAAARLLDIPEDTEAEVDFVSEEEIRLLNAETRGVDAVTDVLSFPNLEGVFGKKLDKRDFPGDVDYETGCLMLGSVAICLRRAEEQAAEFGHSLRREVGYLALHGLLHLLGYDHMESGEKRVMREAEERILSAAKVTREL